MYYLEQIEPQVWPQYTRSVLGRDVVPPGSDQSLSVGAKLSGEPVGLVLARPNKYRPELAIVTLCAVLPRHRRAGVGTALLHRAEALLAARGFVGCETWLMDSHPSKETAARFLQHAEWSELKPAAYFCKTTQSLLNQAEWAQIPIPDCFERFHLSELTEADRSVIEEWNRRELFPASLHPLRYDVATASMPNGSIGIRYQGRLAGWSAARYTAPNQVEVFSLFADPALHRPALPITLLSEAIRITPDREVSFDVSFERDGMKRFVDRRMRPYLSTVRCALRASKALTYAADCAH